MSYQATVVEILLAGPGDVVEERLLITDAIETWNQRHSHHMGLVMRPVKWEADTFPELGGDPQAIINKQLAGRCDAAIAVFAARLGTATPRDVSGTAEEIERFVAEGKPVSVYFSEGQADLTSLNGAQFEALRRYQQSLRDRGTYRGYKSISDLRQLIDQLLPALGYRFQAPQQADKPQQVGARTSFEPDEIDMRVIAAIGRLMVESGSSRISSLILQKEPELSDVSEGRIFESLRVLRARSLATGADGQGRWEVGLTSDGLEMWLLNFVPNHDRTQRQIAEAIVLDNIRDPALLPETTRTPSLIVEHVLQRWVDRGLVIINGLYDGLRIDRFSDQIRQLAEGDVDRAPVVAVDPSDNPIDFGARYRTVAEFIGVDVVALSDFGGELGDPVAAAVKVDGFTVVQVVAPSVRSDWGQQMEDRFRSEVRRLAVSHDLLGRRGQVRLVFDPPQSSAETRDEASGEPVDRKN